MADRKIAVIAGGSTGIGAATARTLAAQGAHVVVAAPCPASEMAPLCEAIHRAGGSASAHSCDVTDRDSIGHLFDSVLTTYGRVDIAINSVGVFATMSVFAPDYAQVDRIIAVNMVGGINFAYAAIAAMRPTGGVLLSITSTQSILSEPDSTVYAATKAAMAHFIASLTPGLQHSGIRALCVAPGATRTPMTAGLHNAQTPEMKAIMAMMDRRHGGAYGEFFVDPERVADVIAFAVSDAASTLQGINIVADQGYTAAQPGIPGVNSPE